MKKLLAVLAMLVFVLACGSKGSSTKEKVFRLNLSGEPASIDPQLSTDSPGGTVNDLINEGLLKRDGDGKIVGGLAEKWEVSEDGLVWTFVLRDGLKWSNGDPLTAQDFKAGWVRALDPKSAAEYAHMLYPIKNAEAFNTEKAKAEDLGIEVVDEKTIKVTLEAVTPYFDDLVTFKTYLPLNTKFFETVGDKYATEAENIVSTGPYKLEKWVHDSEMVLVKNENYYDAANVKVDRVELKMISDNQASINAFKNGEVDVTTVSVVTNPEYKDDPRVTTINDGSVWYALLNNQHAGLKNSKVRKAILMALDREELNNSVLGIAAPVPTTFTPKGLGMRGITSDEFTSEVTTKIPGFNPEEAKKLLAEGLKEEGLAELPALEMIFNDGGNNKLIAEWIQESLNKNLGVTVELVAMTFQERVSRMQQKDFDIVLAGWKGDFKDPITYLDLFVTGGGNNHGAYSNPKYDELVKISKSTGDHAVRTQAMLDIEALIAEDTPVVTLMARERRYIVNERVKGIKFTSIGGDYNFSALDIVEK